MRSILLSVTALGLAAATGLPLSHRHHSAQPATTAIAADPLTAAISSDTVTSGVHPYPGDEGQVLKGATHDLSLLDIRSISITHDKGYGSYGHPDSADDLLIVKEGQLIVSSYDSITGLSAGGIALVNAGADYSIRTVSTGPAVFYLFRFRSRQHNPTFTGGGHYPFLLDWPSIPVQKTAKGESRQIFSQPTTWLTKIDMHATTLNPGEVSHPPHIHRAEEIILMRSGHVQEYINGQHFPAAGGDLIFLASGNPHALENTGTERCEYFALQWQQ
jgi:(S)-ureidoglycine aminohydrolase